jgi:peptidyl-prolyl cis-trans isomerase D
MLSTLRDYSSYFLWFVVITFVGFMAFSGVRQCGASPSSRGVLAEINGQPITLSAYSMAVSRATQNRQGQSNEELTDQQISQIRDQTWQQLVGALLLEQEASRRGVEISDQELANFLRQYPPDELRKIPEFQTEGQFDYNKYLAAMSSTDPSATQFWQQVESFWRPQLRQSKLQQQIISTVRVSDAELVDYYFKTHDAVRIEFIFVDDVKYNKDAGTPTQEQLQELYDQEKHRYPRFERVQLELAVWSRNPSTADMDWARQQAQDIKKQIDAGADFAEMAEQYTMDPSGTSTGGDLGWFGKGAMVAPFETVAFALKPGEVSEPVETQFGIHLIKLEERRPSETDKTQEEIRARHILIKPMASQSTVDSVLHQAQDFAAAVRSGDTAFTQASVQAAGGVWSRPGPMQRMDNIPMVGAAPDLKAWAFNARAGDVCEPIDDGGKFVVAKMVEQLPKGLASLEEVKSQLQQRWISIRCRELARHQADSLFQLAKAGKILKDLASPPNATLTTTGLITRNTSISPVGKSPMFMGAAFSLSQQEPWSDLVPLDNGWAFIHLIEKVVADPANLASMRDSLSTEILKTKQNNAFTLWVSDLYESAKIKDYRGELYGNL